MRNKIVFILLFGLFALPVKAQNVASTEENNEITIGKKFSLASQKLGEERPYWVYLPASYNNSIFAQQSYPVLYLLDGAAHFKSASGVVQFMSTGINANFQIPELIIVAIPNTTDRMRDLTPTHSIIDMDGKEESFWEKSGGGPAFLEFIQEELFPEIESTYRTLPYRILVGHSLGGLLTLYTQFELPEMFQAHIAIDPSVWWDDQLLVHLAEDVLKENRELHGSVYISLANSPDIGSFDKKNWENAILTFAKTLESAASPKFKSTLQYFEAEDHGSVPLLSLYYGLLYIFEGYNPNLDPNPSPSSLITQFEQVSDRLGVTLHPPERFVNFLGYWKLQEQDVDEAIEFFKLNVTNYEKSSNVYDSLGEGYMVKGEKDLAIQNYEKSLELDPANEHAKKQLEVLRSQNE